MVSLGAWMINASALVGLARRLDGSFQLLSKNPHSTQPPLTHFVGRPARIIGASQEGQYEEETKQL